MDRPSKQHQRAVQEGEKVEERLLLQQGDSPQVVIVIYHRLVPVSLSCVLDVSTIVC